MTSTPELRSNELTPEGFWDALCMTDKGFAGISWGGFNLFGDRKSIAELSRLMHQESFIKPLQDRIDLMQRRINELEARLDQNAAK